MPTKSVEDRLAAAQAAIDGALADATVLASLTVVGCGPDYLQAGKALRENALALKQQQKSAYAALKAATKACAAAREQAKVNYRRYIVVARFAFRDDESTLENLDLLGPCKRSQAKWIAQIREFYTNALADDEILERLAVYELTEEQLQAGARQLDALEASNIRRRQCKGAAQRATKARDEALAVLEGWMQSFRALARTALANRPQLLANLGMPTRQ